MTTHDDQGGERENLPESILRPDAPVHVRLAAIGALPPGGEESILRPLRAVAGDRSAPGLVRGAAILALVERGEPVPDDDGDDRAVAAVIARAREYAAARDLVRAAARGDRVALAAEPVLDAPRSAEPIEVIALPAEAARGAAAAAAAGAERGEAAPVVSGALLCAEHEFAVVAPPERLAAEALLKAPAHLGSVAIRDTVEAGAWGDFYEVVTQPDDDGITAFVLDRRGRVRFTGRGTASGDEIEFRLHAVDRPGVTAVEVVARVRAGEVVLEGSTAPGPARRLTPSPTPLGTAGPAIPGQARRPRSRPARLRHVPPACRRAAAGSSACTPTRRSAAGPTRATSAEATLPPAGRRLARAGAALGGRRGREGRQDRGHHVAR